MAFDDRCQPRWSAKAEVLEVWPNAFCKRLTAGYGTVATTFTGYVVYKDKDDKEGFRPAGRAEDAWRNAWAKLPE